jgi:TctA family transporter
MFHQNQPASLDGPRPAKAGGGNQALELGVSHGASLTSATASPAEMSLLASRLARVLWIVHP